MVTAVIVAHDGAAWLPRLMEALGEQTNQVQRVVAVDTGSRDRSGAVLAGELGQGAVFGMDRATGYAAAVRRAVQHKAANVPAGAAVGRGRGDRSDQVEWLWLLHDDCEPAPDALEQLLRGATETPQAVVLGPKLRDWADRDVIVEAGLTIDTAGRRVTGVEPREVDQGQHDGDRDVLAVCSAGLLVRRDVWDRLGGFDPGMALFGEDIDFCWRVHEAGYRIRVITDAVVYHARAATRGRRAISVGRRGRMLERRNGLLTLLGNLPGGPMLTCMAGNVMLSLLRTVYDLVAKRPAVALDEAAAVLGVVGHPLRLARFRRVRAAGRRSAYGAIRADLPPGRSVRRVAELVATLLARPGSDDLAGAHHATDDPTDDDSLLVDSGVLQRLLTRPGVLLVLGLIVVTIAAERRVITSGTLGGGALLPAWAGASGLWSQFFQAYHPVGIGSATYGPPYLGVLAVLATVLLGKVWLAVDVLLLGCVPLAGFTAYLSLRRVTASVPVRVWAAAAYALLPIAFGAISAGRLGSAVVFVLIPVIGMLAGRMVSQPPKLARRAAWATGFTVTIGAAFVPLLWLIVVAAAVLGALALRRSAAARTNLAIVVLTPLALLLPWLLPQLEHPSGLLLEAGVKPSGLAIADLPARSLLLLSPGGPGLPPYWTSAALLVIGLGALATSRRLTLVTAGW
ncbi:MAG: glycosyltransferase family 2 protein, partial [Streptosporangiaceae bacterium]